MQDEDLTHPALPPEEVEKVDQKEWEELDDELEEVLEGEPEVDKISNFEDLDTPHMTVGDRDIGDADSEDELKESTSIGD